MVITIIVPAYNCEKTLSKCIDSLIMQTYKKIEIIIVDDGSSDHTYEVMKKYAKIDERIILVRQENGGPGVARNTGMKLATGRYFTFVDSDDTIEKNYIESMLDIAIKYELDLIISGISIYGEKKINTSGGCNIIIGNTDIRSNVISLIKDGKLNAPCAKLYRRDIQEKNEVYMPTNIDIGEDLQFNLSYIQYVTRMGILDLNLYIYYTCNSTLTRKYRNKEYDIRVGSIKGLENFLENSNIKDIQFVSYLYLKLMYAECMNMRKHLKKKERLVRIEQLLAKEDIQKAIEELKPVGVIRKVMMFGVKTRNSKRIDFVAFLLNIGKMLGKNVKRESV